MRPLTVRWTVGDVSLFGFEALCLSIHGAQRVFGPDAEYVVCVNSVPVDVARERTGPLPDGVTWRGVKATAVLEGLRERLGNGMAEGVGWKLAPPRLSTERHELALDNDCILWDMPGAIREWLTGEEPQRFVIAEDVRRMFGRFEDLCGPEPRNAGIRGLPVGYDLDAALRTILDDKPAPLTSETDEQGLQVAAVEREGPPLVVTPDEVTICSPFWPLLPHLGRCGAHFVALNADQLPWDYEGRPAVELVREHFARHRQELY